MRTKHVFLLATLLVLLVLAVACGNTEQASNNAAPAAANDTVELDLPDNVDAATVASIRAREDVFILDVREDWEYAEGHIPGATLIPLGQIPNRLSEIPKDAQVVTVCRSGNRSNQAAEFLRQQGYENIHNMTGGMIAWGQANLDVEK